MSRFKELLRMGQAVTGALVLMSCIALPARAQSVDVRSAEDFVNRLFATHQSLTAAGLPGVLRTRELRDAFFEGGNKSALPLLAERLHPLTGTADPTLESFQVGTGEETRSDTVRVPVTVRSTSGEVQLAVEIAEADGLRVVDISSGSGANSWSMANMLGVLARLAPGPSASATPQAPSAEPIAQDGEPATRRDIERSVQEEVAQSDTLASDRAALAREDARREDEPLDRQARAARPDARPSSNGAPSIAVDPGAPDLTAQETVPFSDDFDGDGLGEAWRLRHRADDRFLVDRGEILVLARGGGPQFNLDEPANLMILENRTLTGDFDMSVELKIEPKTGGEWVWLGLRNSARDWVAAQMLITWKGCGKAMNLRIDNLRDLDPDADPIRTRFNRNLFEGPFARNICTVGREYADTVLDALASEGVRLTLKKRGFLYTAEIAMDLPASGDDAGGMMTVETPAVTRFEPFGEPALLFGQRERANGESVALIDRFAIEPVGLKR